MDFDREQKRMVRAAGGFAVLGFALTATFWGGLIYFAFWCAREFGLIGGS